MNTEQLIIMINEFLDGELQKEKENLLFTGLGTDEVAREYFKKVNSLKIITNEQTESFPSQLDTEILTEIKSKQNVPVWLTAKSKIVNYASYIILLIAITGGYFLFSQTVYQEEMLQFSKAKIEQQTKLINLIMTNQLAPVTVEPKYENEVVIQATL